MDQRVDDFLYHLRFERGLSPRTVVAYGSDLGQAGVFLASRSRGFVDCDSGDLEGFLVARAEAGDKPRSRARKLSALRTFMAWLLDRGHREADPTSRIEGARGDQGLPVILKVEEVERLLDAPDVRRPEGIRDRAMLEIAYGSGLRVSELVGLRIGDLDMDRALLRVTGKGRRQRIVPTSQTAVERVETWLASPRAELLRAATRIRPDARAALFISRRGAPLTRQGFWKLLKRYGRQVGLPDDLHPHTLRHCFASHLLAGGADLRVVQTLLGHADIRTTEIYTHVEISHLRAEYAKRHPRGR
ncbi:MAG: site-specific tyrosine recombinase [Pseudomonadota bacterium]